jgi:hypothetical protein
MGDKLSLIIIKILETLPKHFHRPKVALRKNKIYSSEKQINKIPIDWYSLLNFGQ